MLLDIRIKDTEYNIYVLKYAHQFAIQIFENMRSNNPAGDVFRDVD